MVFARKDGIFMGYVSLPEGTHLFSAIFKDYDNSMVQRSVSMGPPFMGILATAPQSYPPQE